MVAGLALGAFLAVAQARFTRSVFGLVVRTAHPKCSGVAGGVFPCAGEFGPFGAHDRFVTPLRTFYENLTRKLLLGQCVGPDFFALTGFGQGDPLSMTYPFIL